MTSSLEQVQKHINDKNLREAAYLLFSIARRQTDDYNTFDEVAEINFYYILRKAVKLHPERVNVLFYYLQNVRDISDYLPKLFLFLESGVTKGIAIKKTPTEVLYKAARA